MEDVKDTCNTLMIIKMGIEGARYGHFDAQVRIRA